MDTTAKMMIKKFFDKFAEITRDAKPSGPVPAQIQD